MDNPNWAEIKAADATHLAMVAAWVAAIATIAAAFVAALALKWAKAAAEAARTQIEVLEKQIRLSEPQPVVVIYVRPYPYMIEVENVGDDLAFDVQVGPIVISPVNAGVEPFKMTFQRVSLLKPNNTLAPSCVIAPEILETQDSTGQLFPAPSKFFEKLRDQAVNYWDRLVTNSKASINLATVELSYRNSRGRTFSKSFEILLKDKRLFECLPTISLVSDDKS